MDSEKLEKTEKNKANRAKKAGIAMFALIAISGLVSAGGINISWITDSIDNVIAAKDTFLDAVEFVFEIGMYIAFIAMLMAVATLILTGFKKLVSGMDFKL